MKRLKKLLDSLGRKNIPGIMRKPVIVFAVYFVVLAVVATVVWTRWAAFESRRLPLDPIAYEDSQELTDEEQDTAENTDAEEPVRTAARDVDTLPPVDPAEEVEAALAPENRWQPPLTGEIIFDFGVMKFPTTNDWRTHTGVDIKGELGATVTAARTGTVQEIVRTSEMGWQLKLVHPDGYQTVYASCDKVLVHEGQLVKVGDPVATVGQTALLEYALGPHLHFEVIYQREHIHPVQVLKLR